MLPRLNARQTGTSIPPVAYDREQVIPGIVHLGLGAFHRAHMAVYTDAVLASGDLRWGIIGASLRKPDMRDALEPQDGLYTLAIASTTGEDVQLIGAVQKVIVAPEHPEALLAAMCLPSVAIVSLTITEKGYCHDPASGNLNPNHPDILYDLAHIDAPRSALGFILAAIMRRRATQMPLFTVLSCDNLPANGDTLKRLLVQFAALMDTELADDIAGTLLCPNTMVDRIVPATTEDDKSRIAARLAMRDEAPVIKEPFTQFVIEDRFSIGRPNWAATFVQDVASFELMKLRLLNGSHSCLAYLGSLMGYETVAEAIADPDMAHFIRELMQDSAQTLTLPEGVDVTAYQGQLIERFSNRALKHRTWQIAMDGSQKLPQRWLGTIRDLMAKGLPFSAHALGVAGWCLYIYGQNEQGEKIDIRDPLKDIFLQKQRASAGNKMEFASQILDLSAVFGPFSHDEAFRQSVLSWVRQIESQGVKSTLAQFRR